MNIYGVGIIDFDGEGRTICTRTRVQARRCARGGQSGGLGNGVDGAVEFEVDGISGGGGDGIRGEGETVVTNVDANIGSGDETGESKKGGSELHG